MKICPFISHMIGEGQINILEMEGADAPELSAKAKEQVVILGYDGDDGDEASAKAGKKAKAKTKSKTKAKSKTGAGGDQSETSPLFCMKDSCRFFLTDSKSCTFDDMYGMAADRAKEFQVTKDAQDELGKNVMGELGKFWKFQTKSVSELISSIGDTEKNQQKAIETLSKSIDKRIGAAIHHRNLGTVDLDHAVVDIEPAQRRHQMLDGGHRGARHTDRGAKVCRVHITKIGRDLAIPTVIEIGPAEIDTAICLGRMQSDRSFPATMDTDT